MSPRERQFFSLIIKREIAIKSDELATEAKEIIDTFNDALKKNMKKTQIHSLENIARCTSSKSDITDYIKKQASKDMNKKSWAKEVNGNSFKESCNRKIESVVEDVKMIYDVSCQRLNELLEEQNQPKPKYSVQEQKEFMNYIEIGLVRKFIQHIAVYYYDLQGA